MTETVQKLRIFVASPKDCDSERTALRNLVTAESTVQTAARLNVSVEVFGWENVSPEVGRPQEVINAAITKYDPDWFVFIFWHRLGSDAGEGMTGTEEEWDIALELKQQSKDKSVGIYFNRAEARPYEIDGFQLEAVKAFREKIFKGFKALTRDFNGTKDFEEKFRVHLFQKLLDQSPIIPKGVPYFPRRLLDVSVGLINWPTTLGQGKYIERHQLRALFQKIEETASSSTILLGAPGTGKSALLATFAKRLRDQGFPLLAIKADQLGPDVNSLEDLRRFLDLSISPLDAIQNQSSSGKIVLIVDQLDAVSELLDRKSGRLNVLLNLIHSLAGRNNIHVVASSREFEFRHDVRLSSIEAERLDLEPPKWDQISEILVQAGINPETIGEPLKNLLLVPLNLKVFLDVAIPSATFESHHALLEQLWQQRVISGESGADRERLLELLADRMSKEETLWLPSAVADNYPAARQELEQAEILTREPKGLTIGFRHQTFYDFSLARAFARGSLSLARHILDRQDGLFVRPILLSGLNYLRATARSEYHKQLSFLMDSKPRLHLRMLVIEFLGGQSDPDEREEQLLLPLLDSADEGPRVLRSVAQSAGWFARLKEKDGFRKWLSSPPDKAAHCVLVLSSAIQFSQKESLGLVEKFWIEDEAYDALSFRVLLEAKDWDKRAIGFAVTLVRRTEFGGTEILAERIAESLSSEAPSVIRADFDRRLDKALKELEQPVPSFPAAADKQQRLMHELSYEKSRPIRQLMEDSRLWYNLEEFASKSPKTFLVQLWPWFLRVVRLMAEDEHEFVLGYRSDPTSYRSFEGDVEPAKLVEALLAAIVDLAKSDRESFLDFFKENLSSDLLIVHRLLTRGLESMAPQDSQTGLEYLCDDPRRLILGDMHDRRAETKRLIKAVSPHIGKNGIRPLEQIILAHTRYPRVLPEWSAEERLERRKWDRQERLDLLRAIPLDLLSASTKKLRLEEERVFPESSLEEISRTGPLLSTVGARMTVGEMADASDEELLRLFDKLPDSVGWDNPKRKWSQDMSRAGGAIQQSREFGELAKQSPNRVFSLMSSLRPNVHEQYAGEAVKGLASSNLPTAEIISLIEDLDNRGFRSRDFRDDVASAAEIIAGRAKGLSDIFLQRMEGWLNEITEPVWPPSEPNDSKSDPHERTTSILYGHGITASLTHGRGSIMRTIAEGYVQREPSAIEGWARVIESRLFREKHPQIWSEVLTRMPVLFQGDHRRATDLFDGVIKACPQVLRYPFALSAIAHIIRGVEPKEKGEEWLNSLLRDGSSICRQAYGELLPLFHCCHQDSNSANRIASQLKGDHNVDIDRGLAYAAAHLWASKRCREMATGILISLASAEDESVQRAVAGVFRLTRDYFELDANMRSIIEAVRTKSSTLLLAAEDLIQVLEDYTGTEPDLVSLVCVELLKSGADQIDKPGASWIFVTESLTNIALTLHRQEAFREVGLKLFEQLISLNIREARAAIELLDRRPVISTLYQHRPRWRRKTRRLRQSS